MKSNATLILTLCCAIATAAAAHETTASTDFNRGRCTFTTTGNNLYLPLLPGLTLVLEGEEDSEGELVTIQATTTVLDETEIVDGIETRVVEERELEEGDLTEITRNFMAVCRETGDVWYFGEDVDNYEDGVIVNHNGSFRAGINGAQPGILMPGSPLNGAHYYQEQAPGVAEDSAEILGLQESAVVPAGTFHQVLVIADNDDEIKLYAPGLGQIVDENLRLVEVVEPFCRPDATTHCLANGRFRVTANWRDAQGQTGNARAILGAADSGEFWFFGADNTELVVKVLDACTFPGSNRYWVFAAGLTNVEVNLTVVDTKTPGTSRTYFSPLGTTFAPITDTSAFATCP